MLCIVIKSNTTNLGIYSAETHCNNFENLKANIFSTDTFSDNASDPDIYRFVVFLQENLYKENGPWDCLNFSLKSSNVKTTFFTFSGNFNKLLEKNL